MVVFFLNMVFIELSVDVSKACRDPNSNGTLVCDKGREQKGKKKEYAHHIRIAGRQCVQLDLEQVTFPPLESEYPTRPGRTLSRWNGNSGGT